jgi:ribosomal protein S18 acetylase RimI-like enzyme
MVRSIMRGIKSQTCTTQTIVWLVPILFISIADSFIPSAHQQTKTVYIGSHKPRRNNAEHFIFPKVTALASKLTPAEIIDISDGDEMPRNLPDGIQIRQAEKKDLKAASKILTDAFFSFNIFSTPFEWLNTFLSLQDSLEETNDLYNILVAFRASDDLIVGMCEIDCRLSPKPDKAPPPYICNLAVNKQWRNKGIGKALINVCEDLVVEVWRKEFLYLRVRRNNENAIAFYKQLGYAIVEIKQPVDRISGDDIMLLEKKLSATKTTQ